MDPVLSITVLSVVLGALIALFFFKSYFGKRRSEVQSIAKAELQPDHKKPSKPSQPISKKSHSKPHTHASDKDQNKRHHPLDVNTLKGHGDSVTGLCFSFDGRNLATACADGVVRVFKLDDALSKSFKFLRINLPPGGPPTAVTFTDDASSIVVATHNLSGSSLYMYGEEKTTSVNENKQQAKLPLPEIKWEHHKIHDKRAILTLYRATASYGSGDGSTIIASCSEGTDIIIWHGKTGKILGHVDSNQLKNHMAAISPNGRFLAAAAFTADVKVWEIVYSKDGSVKEVSKAMQLKGHKSAVTWLCFAPNSEQIITASKDDSIRIWNINVRYHLDEDPKTLKVFPIPLRDSSGAALHYDRLSLSPDGRILAATHRSTLQWLSVETGKVLDMADKAHEGDITSIAWAPKTIPMGNGQGMILATSSGDKKVKLWTAPSLD
ncbi:transducin beta-like protein 2 [Pistacia vera]|uniref:transducin beta-like protein 2 n=1 Tax=Pistacia vera TaxID=55513 RepID=UPI0012631571|nr:transducin beta-like protein 2 [Pistacia vera]